jgi:hypothetical protein
MPAAKAAEAFIKQYATWNAAKKANYFGCALEAGELNCISGAH